MSIQHTGKDIMSGLNPSFIAKIKRLANEVRFTDKSVIFRQGTTAEHFFTLVEGNVSLCLGQKGHAIYRVEHSGEAFGWSSLTGCNVYTASAITATEAKVLKFDGNKLKSLLDERPEESLKFYQNLSRTLDSRLHQSYDLLTSITQDCNSAGADAGHLQDPFELI